MKLRNKKGFTIVELVIVIAVVAILAAVLIPTFAGLVEKANRSVDMQLVKSMNDILITEEVTGNKPVTVVDAKKILSDNGISQFKPVASNNVFYWVGTDNRVLLWEKDEEAATGKVTYPEDSKKKYADLTAPSVDWADMSLEQTIEAIQPADGETVAAALINALGAADATSDVYLKLPADSTVTMSYSDLQQFNNSLKSGSVGKKVHIDLNGNTMNITNSDDSQHAFVVPTNGVLELSNGKVDYNPDKKSKGLIVADTGASVILKSMNITGKAYAGIFPAASANEIIIEDSNIDMETYYVFSTNGLTTRDLRLSITNSTINSKDSIGVLVNVQSTIYIENSTISGLSHGLVLRAGEATVKNSTIASTDAESAVIFKWDTFTHFPKKVAGDKSIYAWSEGNRIPGAALVLGDYIEDASSYAGDVKCTLDNVNITVANAADYPKILVAAKQTKNVTLTYDTTIGDVTYYGMIPEWFGSITINGVAKNYDGTNK